MHAAITKILCKKANVSKTKKKNGKKDSNGLRHIPEPAIIPKIKTSPKSVSYNIRQFLFTLRIIKHDPISDIKIFFFRP